MLNEGQVNLIAAIDGDAEDHGWCASGESETPVPTAAVATIRVRPVRGWCPMGCGETLYLLTHGDVRCARGGCPRPTAVAELLAEQETEHIVDVFPSGTFTVQHPLRERLDGGLRECRLGNHVVAVPPPPGRYRYTVRPRTFGRTLDIDMEQIGTPAAPPADQPLFQ